MRGLLGLFLVTGLGACASSSGADAISPADVDAVTLGASANGASTPGIPSLRFHQICTTACTAEDTYGVSSEELDRILTLLDTRGYRTISIADFARAHRGDRHGLPDRPVLLTFDDGRQDAYVGADPILAKHRMQATMFVITKQPSDKPTYYMSWPEIQDAANSGRWDMQVHAHAGHVQIPVAAKGVLGSFYANASCTTPECHDLESHDAWSVRAKTDIEAAERVLASKIGGRYASHSFAVPYNDFGQNRTNDRLIPDELRAYFDAHYEVWFTQADDAEFMTPSAVTHRVDRFVMTNKIAAADVEAWLAKHEPR